MYSHGLGINDPALKFGHHSIKLRELLVPRNGRCGGFMTSPYDTPESYSVGAPHVGILQMIHVPDGFGEMI